jgi:tRNA uridine 5-carboxymethylaminomethyl modification enzyme
MFTSRAEFRLRLRADNADQRLTSLGLDLGCVGSARAAAFASKAAALATGDAKLRSLSLTPNEAARCGFDVNRDGRRRTAFDLLALPGITLARLVQVWPELGAIPPAIAGQLETDARYASYVERQSEDVAALRRDEATPLPPDLDYGAISGLSAEIRQKLAARRPGTLAEASRIDGMTPAALFLLLAHAKRPARRSA